MLHSSLFEFFWFEDLARLGTVLQDSRANFLIGVFYVINFGPVDWLFFIFWEMHNSKLSFIPKLVHPPRKEIMVVLEEDFLGQLVAIW